MPRGNGKRCIIYKPITEEESDIPVVHTKQVDKYRS